MLLRNTVGLIILSALAFGGYRLYMNGNLDPATDLMSGFVAPDVVRVDSAEPDSDDSTGWQFDTSAIIQSIFRSEPAKAKSTQVVQEELPFSVIKTKWNPEKRAYDFYRVGMDGEECHNTQDARRYFLSENQADYPEPESGCGPTALLNLYIWYTKFGLIKETNRHADLKTYKQQKFREIDTMIYKIQGRAREETAGTNNLEQVVVIDNLLQAHSDRTIRMHANFVKAPLEIKDFTDITRGYRAGILTVYPLDLETGKLLGSHAVLVIRGDTSGQVTIANWGQFVHGRLQDKKDGQWFIPNDPKHNTLFVRQLTQLIPFVATSSTTQ